MKRAAAATMSPWRLRCEIVFVTGLARLVFAGQSVQLSPEFHVFLYDRYWRLAKWHEARGRTRRSHVLKTRALSHWEQTDYDGPPFAGALAMPIPMPPIFTWAVAGRPREEDVRRVA
jgi:hypothetical protein